MWSQLVIQNIDNNPRMAWIAERHSCTHPHTDKASENRQQTEGLQCHRTLSGLNDVMRWSLYRNSRVTWVIVVKRSHVSRSRDNQSRELLSWQAAAWVMICRELRESLSWQAVTWNIAMTSHVSHDLSRQAVTWVIVMASRYVSRRYSQVCHCHDKRSRESCKES